MTAAGDRVRVLVVDDSAEARRAIGDAVALVSGFELAGSVASGDEALAVLPRIDPDLVLLDVRMTGLDGLETSRLIRESGHRAAVVLVSAFRRSELPDQADSCGAVAILHKAEVCPRRLSTLWQRLRADHDEPTADNA
jgi:two-component system invasion response regulator UvrY